MPIYHSHKYRSKKRPSRKFRKMRSRFAKRFKPRRAHANQIKIRQPAGLADSLRVSLKFPFSYTAVLDEQGTGTNQAASPGQLMWNGSGYPNLFGTSPLTASFPIEVPVGFSQYTPLYSKFRCYGSTIKLSLVNLNGQNLSTTAFQPFRIGLFTAPYDGFVEAGGINYEGYGYYTPQTLGLPPPTATCLGALSTYQGATFNTLLNEPFIKWKLMHSANDQKCEVKFHSHRNTAKQCSVKYIKDNPTFDNDVIQSAFPNTDYPGSSRGFVWILKVSSLGNANALTAMVTGSITYHYEFFDRLNLTNPQILAHA